MTADSPRADAPSRPRSPVVARFDPAAGVIPGGTGIERRDVDTAELAANLRAVLELPSGGLAPGEAAALYGDTLPSIVRGLDTGGWIAWCIASLPLFSGPQPPLRALHESIERVPITLAMLRAEGDIRRAARVLYVSPRDLRAELTALGLWPWRRVRNGEGESEVSA